MFPVIVEFTIVVSDPKIPPPAPSLTFLATVEFITVIVLYAFPYIPRARFSEMFESSTERTARSSTNMPEKAFPEIVEFTTTSVLLASPEIPCLEFPEIVEFVMVLFWYE